MSESDEHHHACPHSSYHHCHRCCICECCLEEKEDFLKKNYPVTVEITWVPVQVGTHFFPNQPVKVLWGDGKQYQATVIAVNRTNNRINDITVQWSEAQTTSTINRNDFNRVEVPE